LVSRAQKVFDEHDELQDEAIRKQLGDFLRGFAAYIAG
jgi:chromate reductase